LFLQGHFIGFIAGITFGTYILTNDVERAGELYIRWGGISVYLAVGGGNIPTPLPFFAGGACVSGGDSSSSYMVLVAL
jgi:hypothetical protein